MQTFNIGVEADANAWGSRKALSKLCSDKLKMLQTNQTEQSIILNLTLSSDMQFTVERFNSLEFMLIMGYLKHFTSPKLDFPNC